MNSYDDADLDELETSFILEAQYLPGGTRPLAGTLEGLVRQYIEDGGLPPVPRPTVGLPEGGDLPLFYPGLNAIAGPPGVGKSTLLKWVARQEVRDFGHHVVALDDETSRGEWASTLRGDFDITADEAARVHYVTDDQTADDSDILGADDRWSGRMDDALLDSLDIDDTPPSLVIIDSASKSIALGHLDEIRALDATIWFQGVCRPIQRRWPDAAVVLVQARPKGYTPGMDVRSGKGSISFLHEVRAQYVMWEQKAGSRSTQGWAELNTTKDRYGWRADDTAAAGWHYGPEGLWLAVPVENGGKATDEDVQSALLAYLATDPRDPALPALPPSEKAVIGHLAGALKVKTERVKAVLAALVTDRTVRRENLDQGSKRGVKPFRVWLPIFSESFC